MTITAATADALDALALQIFNLNIIPNPPETAGLGWHFDPTRYTGIKTDDPAINAQYYALIAPVMLAIDGLVMETGFRYALNFTCALKGRPKHWFLEGLNEFETGGANTLPAVSVAFQYHPAPGYSGLSGDWQSYGFYIGGATCAGICKLWAQIVRMWLAGEYPLAVTQPT